MDVFLNLGNQRLASREPTYPTFAKGKSSSNMPNGRGYVIVHWRVDVLWIFADITLPVKQPPQKWMVFAGDPASFLGASGCQGLLPWLSEWLDRSDGMVKWKFLGEGNQKKRFEHRIKQINVYKFVYIHPGKLTCGTQTWRLWIRWFLGSMLIFRGVLGSACASSKSLTIGLLDTSTGSQRPPFPNLVS